MDEEERNKRKKKTLMTMSIFHSLLGGTGPFGDLLEVQLVSGTQNDMVLKDVPLVEFMYLVFTHVPGESYRRRLRSLLLCLCDDFRALINSLVYIYST